jgi:hypothetical protein
MMKLTLVTLARVWRLGKSQNIPICSMNITVKVIRRPSTSDT